MTLKMKLPKIPVDSILLKKINWLYVFKIVLLVILLLPTIQIFIEIPRIYETTSTAVHLHTKPNPVDEPSIKVLTILITFIAIISVLCITFVAMHAVVKENGKWVSIFSVFLAVMVILSAFLKLETPRLLLIDGVRSILFFFYSYILCKRNPTQENYV